MRPFSLTRRGFPWAVALVASSCASSPGPAPVDRVPLVRHGPDRADVPYLELFPEAKAKLFSRVNAERQKAGLSPVLYDRRAARVGDAFCLDAAKERSSGHWDTSGRPPYLRWGLGGGVDYSAENFSSLTRTGAPVEEKEAERLLLSAHAGMMAEVPPNDGHRRTVLDPLWTHVGFGVAVDGGEFRMVEEFSRHVAEWISLPAAPLPAGTRAPFALKLPAGWNLGAVEVGYERPPRSLSREEVRRRGAYAYPAASQQFRVRTLANTQYPDGSRGDLYLVNGVLRLEIPLLAGAGDYYVFVYAGPGPVEGRKLAPLTAALIQAR